MKLTRVVLVLSLVAAMATLAVWSAEPPKSPKPLSEPDVLKLIELQIDDDAIIARIAQGQGVAFEMDDAVAKRLKEAGASAAVLAALRGQKPDTGGADLTPDPALASVTVRVTPWFASTECPLHTEMRVNGQLVNVFTSETYQEIGKHLKMGWNTVTLKTTLKGSEKGWNFLRFDVGPARKDPKTRELVMEPVLWSFNNGTDWSHDKDKISHRSGPDVREATLTFPLYFAGLKHEGGQVKAGDYVLHNQQWFSGNTPVTLTLFVNGTPLTTFLGQYVRDNLIVTPLLKKGKNEIKVVARRVGGSLEHNYTLSELGGPAEYNAVDKKFVMRPLLTVKSLEGWTQDKKTAQWFNETKPDADTVERVLTVYLDEAPGK